MQPPGENNRDAVQNAHPRHQQLSSLLTRCAIVCQQLYEQRPAPFAWDKPDGTRVTISDLLCQALIGRVLAESAPGERVFAEEDAESLHAGGASELLRELLEGETGRSVSAGEAAEWLLYDGSDGPSTPSAWWYVDPVDGTRGYELGLISAVAVARAEREGLTHGYLGVPESPGGILGVSGRIFAARRGGGAFWRPLAGAADEEVWTPANVSEHPFPAGRVVIAASGGARHVDLPQDMRGGGWQVDYLDVDSQAKYAAIALGLATIYPRKPSRRFGHFFAWDHAAGALLVEEAGGVATDLAGRELQWLPRARLVENTGLFVASSKPAHEALQPLFWRHIQP